MCNGDVVDEVPNHAYRRVRVDDLEKSALPKLFAITQVLGKRIKSCRRQPCRVIVGLVDDVIGGFGEGFLRIVGYDQTPNGACESNVFVGRFCFFNSATYWL